MVSQSHTSDGAMGEGRERPVALQSEVRAVLAVENQAMLMVSLYGKRQALEEAELRASAARAYSSRLSAEFWDRVVAALV